LVELSLLLVLGGGITYLVLTDGVTTIRRGIRDYYLVTDITLTPTGFNGTENTDWENIEALMVFISDP